MGKEGRNKKKGLGVTSGNQSAITLREEVRGRKQHKGGSCNVKSVLKLQHFKKLATWAGGEASIPSFGAFFGHRLGSCAEAMGIPLDSSLFPCQRCESILQLGHNCTVRIESNRAKVRRRHKKSSMSTQNNVVYTCHFCLHRNLKRGTLRGHMTDIFPSKPRTASESQSFSSTHQKSTSLKKGGDANKKMEEMISLDQLVNSESQSSPKMHQTTAGEIFIEKSQATPLGGTASTLLEGKKRKISRSGSNKPVGSESNSATMDKEKSKRKRKSWSSLKEIAQNSKHTGNIPNLTIPFLI